MGHSGHQGLHTSNVVTVDVVVVVASQLEHPAHFLQEHFLAQGFEWVSHHSAQFPAVLLVVLAVMLANVGMDVGADVGLDEGTAQDEPKLPHCKTCALSALHLLSAHLQSFALPFLLT